MRKSLSTAMVAVFAFMGVAVPAQPAEALPASGVTYTRTTATFDDVKWVKVDSTLCLRVVSKAKLRVTFKRLADADDEHRDVYRYSNPRIRDVSTTVTTYKTCNFDKPVKLRSIRISQFYSIANRQFCSLNPSLSLGLPWSVSLSVAPTCSASAKSAIGTPNPQLVTSSTNSFKDAYSGAIGGWPDAAEWVYEDEATKVCVFPSANVTVMRDGKNVTKQRINGFGSYCAGVVKLARS